MTSKSPVRSCDDVDEDVLSYAEIKALCAGDPHIKEKMQLETEVSKLKMLKADHQSQQYRLQDNILQHLPIKIESARSHIEGFKSDIIRLESNTHMAEESISPMMIGEITYTDRRQAGAALLKACKGISTSEPTRVGSYRGFNMYISYDKSTNEFKADMKGCMTHTATLGNDSSGNITRINNAFDKIPARLASVEAQLETLYSQQANAKAELGKPFEFEQELTEKSMRLAELDSMLNLDEKPDTVVLDDVVEETADCDIAAKANKNNLMSVKAEPASKKEKPSVLALLEKNAEKSKAMFGCNVEKVKRGEVTV